MKKGLLYFLTLISVSSMANTDITFKFSGGDEDVRICRELTETLSQFKELGIIEKIGECKQTSSGRYWIGESPKYETSFTLPPYQDCKNRENTVFNFKIINPIIGRGLTYRIMKRFTRDSHTFNMNGSSDGYIQRGDPVTKIGFFYSSSCLIGGVDSKH